MVSTTEFLIAIIKCGSPSPAILETHGEYGDIIAEMLDSMMSTLPESKTKISYLAYDARNGRLPGWNSVYNFDAVIVTGSGKNKLYYAFLLPKANKRFDRLLGL